MQGKSGFVLVVGIVLVVWAAHKTLGLQHIVLDFTTSPQNQADGIGRFQELAPYFAALGGVVVGTVVASSDDDVANIILLIEGIAALAMLIAGSGSNQSNAASLGGGRTQIK